MSRKLKVYQTSLGFFDLAVAVPSKAAALRAWNTRQNLFQQGFAIQSDDKNVIAAAMAHPGVVLRRPVGSKGRFQEHAQLPTADSLAMHLQRREVPRKESKPPRPTKPKESDEKAERNATAAFEKEERRRELRRQKDEAAAAKIRARRHAAMEKAKSALEKARREHEKRTAFIEKDREALEGRAKEEDIRWEKLKSRLEAALQKAGR